MTFAEYRADLPQVKVGDLAECRLCDGTGCAYRFTFPPRGGPSVFCQYLCPACNGNRRVIVAEDPE